MARQSTKKPFRKPSRIFVLHYVKLIYRSVLFLAALGLYLHSRIHKTGQLFAGVEEMPAILSVIWLVYAAEMLLRFFPSQMESMGCQKQFARNFQPTGVAEVKNPPGSWKRTAAVVAAWMALNGIFWALYLLKVIDAGILLLLALAYAVCDMICILFFCPFQTWFLKNRCCTTCRIYNWDFAMMFTPIVFVKSGYCRSLVLLSLLLLIKWEYLYHRYPERFSEQTNRCLNCGMCEEKLCHHKKQLHSFWRKNLRRVQSVSGELLADAVERPVNQ